jgi:hypothetical protein
MRGTRWQHAPMYWCGSTLRANGTSGPQNSVPIMAHALPPVHLSGAFYNYVTSKVRGDLPSASRSGCHDGRGDGNTSGSLVCAN